MLPESNFPITGGIMQTEEIVRCAQPSLELDASKSFNRLPSPFYQNNNNNKITSPIDSTKLIDMAVKQEPHTDEDHNRDPNSVSPPTESKVTPSVPEPYLKQIKQSNEPQLDSANVQKKGDEETRNKTGRARRKARWKLTFHHQALPPEYLDHYEAALAQEALNTPPASSSSSSTSESQANSTASSSAPTGDVQSWIQRIAAMQNELAPNSGLQSHFSLPNNSCKSSALQSHFTLSNNSCKTASPRKASASLPAFGGAESNQRPPMKYSDLPYMGEITLDNSKPRRGRKPKKADICHLIYKNYGTILPGTPGQPQQQDLEIKNGKSKAPVLPNLSKKEIPEMPMVFQRTDLQNKIISSLLEKRLTQEKKGLLASNQPEPLNLCIRDLNYLKIRLPVKSEVSSDTEDNSDHSNGDGWPVALQSQLNTFYQKLKEGDSPNSNQSESAPLKRNSVCRSPTPQHQAKRKRSAIFIPPVPAENNNNPATEVSICKFKFTGGAKPSLQEKKSLSVDSGGNFRYYSGTGDKSMRGYEFFPRETLAQSQSAPPTPEQLTPPAIPSPVADCKMVDPLQLQLSAEELRRKRKTRKSVQREKLEQTFKEKGFLIQTQQLESAEGATYCKFRQLRKFTRYLFRSWKDYLPENVSHQMTDASGEPIIRDPADMTNHGFDLSKTMLEEPKSVPLT